MNMGGRLIVVFLSCVVLVVLLVRDIQMPDVLTEKEKRINLVAQVVLSFFSSAVILLYATYILRPPFHIWLSILTLLILLLTPFSLILLRFFLKDTYHIRTMNIFTILSVLTVMVYTFKAAGG
jgi:hypothetical protein